MTQVKYRNGLYTNTVRTQAGSITDICTVVTSITGCEMALQLSTELNFGFTVESVQQIKYREYDSFGNIGVRHNVSQDIHERFDYDILERITGVTLTNSTGDSLVTDYAYDASGNFTKKSDFSKGEGSYNYGNNERSTANAGPNAVTEIRLADNAFGLHALNRVMNLNYDGNGNLTDKTIRIDGNNDPATILAYEKTSYNSDNKPISITNYNAKTTTFSYGSDGRIV